jgi:hypothetical protein
LWEPAESFLPPARWHTQLEEADLHWLPEEELELAREPMPDQAKVAPSWLSSLGPADIESFDGLVAGKVQKLRFTLKGTGKKKKQPEHERVATGDRDCAEVQQLLHQG